jgi:hypothetical protein
MWVFHQMSGGLERNGKNVSSGYSGVRSLQMISADVGLRSLYEDLRNCGPIPLGVYEISWSRSRKSPDYVLSLTPLGHKAHGRDAFLIHGDYLCGAAKGTASEGCIILPLDARKRIWQSGDNFLWGRL